ncbi:MAG: zinc ribbon domain-containing protein [Actinomycetota bacterium]|nr:zinc ribbon domain-containing protein [Actinomycetota bacterium]
MPIYEFLCGECGSFEERRSFEEAGNQAVCPGCGTTAQRVYSMPNLRTTAAALSNAMNRVEKSAHEPGVMRQPEGDALPGKRYRLSHGGHGGHGH